MQRVGQADRLAEVRIPGRGVGEYGDGGTAANKKHLPPPPAGASGIFAGVNAGVFGATHTAGCTAGRLEPFQQAARTFRGYKK